MTLNFPYLLSLSNKFYKLATTTMQTWWIMPNGEVVNLHGQYHGLYIAEQQGTDTTDWEIADIEDVSSRVIDDGGITLRMYGPDKSGYPLIAHTASIDENAFYKIKSALEQINIDPAAKVFIHGGPAYGAKHESLKTDVASIMLAKSLRDLKKHLSP